MAYEPNDDLKRAIEALTLFQVWAAAHRDGAVLEPVPGTQRDDQYKSPFREDGKNGSFSICHDGRGFKDFGGSGTKGGVWQFAKLCWPNKEGRVLAEELIALSGISRTVPRKPQPGATAAAPIDPAIERAAKSIARSDRVRQAEAAVYEDREKALRPPSVKTAAAWPQCVKAHYNEGVEHMLSEKKRIADLARDRGWPEDWARVLVEMGLVAYPWERWARAGEKFAGRQKAFLVQAPRFKMAATALDAVGYHQRFYQPASEGRPENKGWLYVPSLPKNGPRSPLEEQLVAYGETLGIEKNERRALVPPLPFVLGDLQAPRLIVLLEGQWDAITFFGACGWFHDTTPAEGVAVFGIRGAQGTDAFLGHWAPWLERIKPRVWVIADNDAAGGSWRERPAADPGLPWPPSLAERLVAVGCRAPLVSWLTPGKWGKDFNDYYKAAKPGPEKMRTWMHKVGIMDASGGWA